MVSTSTLVLSSEIVSSDIYGLFFDTLAWGILIGILAGLIYTFTAPIWWKGRL